LGKISISCPWLPDIGVEYPTLLILAGETEQEVRKSEVEVHISILSLNLENNLEVCGAYISFFFSLPTHTLHLPFKVKVLEKRIGTFCFQGQTEGFEHSSIYQGRLSE
jgi:hypothetical protein